MRWHAHDCAGTVIHEDVVRHPDGNLLTIERIDRVTTGGHAVLFNFADVSGFFGLTLLGNKLIDFRAQAGIRRGELDDDRVLRRKLDRSRAENRIYTRCEYADGRAGRAVALGISEFEIHQRAFAAANPVALHGANFFRPAVELVEIAQQLIGIPGDAEEPLL